MANGREMEPILGNRAAIGTRQLQIKRRPCIRRAPLRGGVQPAPENCQVSDTPDWLGRSKKNAALVSAARAHEPLKIGGY